MPVRRIFALLHQVNYAARKTVEIAGTGDYLNAAAVKLHLIGDYAAVDDDVCTVYLYIAVRRVQNTVNLDVRSVDLYVAVLGIHTNRG